ncbi:hypothetical protein FHX42_003986 [Saccharopolyspora lacisalsi]|uniref:Uncharacterized protein n=1 Tax=Halosaccharopolyspora lacisalsi TaxID=1000566 RepID=A0A839E4E9_9PSEU|nr:hypothetical protein [Halosaccharopolyspora lacisalsi]MBA8826607.1 hypothetical protein [Halosaccharopolyspora lacisalsi]
MNNEDAMVFESEITKPDPFADLPGRGTTEENTSNHGEGGLGDDYGGTDWRRFAMILFPSLAAAAILASLVLTGLVG